MRKLLLCMLGFVLLSATDSRSPEATNAKVKTVFIYNFTKYIDWPQSAKSGSFVIGVLGNDPYLVKELKVMASKKTVGAQQFLIKSLNALDKKSNYHMLFLCKNAGYTIDQVKSILKGKSTLIVSEKPGFAKKGAGINFVFQNSRQKFELNKSSVENHNLKVSSNLVDIAIKVD